MYILSAQLNVDVKHLIYIYRHDCICIYMVLYSLHCAKLDQKSFIVLFITIKIEDMKNSQKKKQKRKKRENFVCACGCVLPEKSDIYRDIHAMYTYCIYNT